MKLKLTQGMYMRLLGLLFLIIAFGSCFSYGYAWNNLNPGDKAVKFAFILMYFLGFWFFLNMGIEMQQQEADSPTEEEAKSIVEAFESSKGKPKKSISSKRMK